MRVSVVGLGVVGLTTAACSAHRGFRVVGLDIDEPKVKALNDGNVPFYEPDLEALVKDSLRAGRLSFTTDYGKAILSSEISFICVGTPPSTEGTADLSQITSSLRSLGEALKKKNGHHLVVIRSTVPPGTTDGLVKRILESSSGKALGDELGLCSCPEFLREGSAVQDMLYPDRVIIGELDDKSGDILTNFWEKFYLGQRPPIIRTKAVNAELIKYASNAFLAMKVSFINSLANLCEKVQGADVEEVAKGIGYDKRIGHLFLKAGLGFGGSCLGRDLRTLLQEAENLGIKLPLMNSILDVNELQPLRAVKIAKEELGELRGKRFGLLGLAFKPNTDDVRDAVALKLIGALLDEGVKVVAYDPKANDNVKRVLGDKIEYASSALECIKGADCCILVTEWEEFKNLKPKDFIENMKSPFLIDGRRLYDWRDFHGKMKFRAIGLGEYGPHKAMG